MGLELLIPLILGIAGTAVSAGTSIANTNKQVAAQEKMYQQQQAEQERITNMQRLQNANETQYNNQRIVNQFQQNLNTGVSTSTNNNVGISGLNAQQGYVNEYILSAQKMLNIGGKKVSPAEFVLMGGDKNIAFGMQQLENAKYNRGDFSKRNKQREIKIKQL